MASGRCPLCGRSQWQHPCPMAGGAAGLGPLLSPVSTSPTNEVLTTHFNVYNSQLRTKTRNSALTFFYTIKTTCVYWGITNQSCCTVTAYNESSAVLDITACGLVPHLLLCLVRPVNLSRPSLLHLYSVLGWITRSQNSFPYLVYYFPMK